MYQEHDEGGTAGTVESYAKEERCASKREKREKEREREREQRERTNDSQAAEGTRDEGHERTRLL